MNEDEPITPEAAGNKALEEVLRQATEIRERSKLLLNALQSGLDESKRGPFDLNRPRA